MIHYHGTPITPNHQLERMAGMHFCVSFHRPDQLDRCLRIGQSLLLDNGAFSTWRIGAPFDERGYYAWLDKILVPPHWAIIPDAIGAGELENDEMLRRWPRSEFRDLGAPVWHLDESVDRLERLVDAWPRVCLGSAGHYKEVGTPAWSSRMDEAFNVVARSAARLPWIHGLRMLGQTAGGWPLASADSTNVAQNWKRDTGCAFCKASAIDAQQVPSLWNPRPTQKELLK